MFGNLVNALEANNMNKRDRVRGTVILMKKNVLDFNDLSASLLDRLHEFVGKRVSLQLISASQADPGQYFFLFHVQIISLHSYLVLALLCFTPISHPSIL